TTASAATSQSPITRNGWRAQLRPRRNKNVLTGSLLVWVMWPAECGTTSPSRDPLTSDCTPAEPDDLSAPAPGQSGSERHLVAELTVLSEFERGQKRVFTEESDCGIPGPLEVVGLERGHGRAGIVAETVGMPEQVCRVLASASLGGEDA